MPNVVTLRKLKECFNGLLEMLNDQEVYEFSVVLQKAINRIEEESKKTY